MSESYPALLCNLPCVVETHKTYDKTTFYKSNDVGQILYVFENNQERERMRNDVSRYSSEGFNGMLSSGLTPPTNHIISRRFLKTRPPGHGKYQPKELSELINEITTSPLAEGALGQVGWIYKLIYNNILNYNTGGHLG